MKKNTDITLNDLALMVKQGFDAVDKRFESVDERFESIDNRLENLEKGQEEIKLRLDNVAYRFELLELEQRVHYLEKLLKVKYAS